MTDDVWREFFDSFAPQYMNEAFTADSESHVSVWRRHGEPSPQSVQTLRT